MKEQMEEQKTCETCRYFYQHYVKVGKNKYTSLVQGHCGNPRARDKRVDTPSCHRYAKRPNAT